MIQELLVSLALLVAASGPDKVKLQDGKVLEGRVVHEGRDSIVLRENKKDRTIPRGEIAELTTLERSLGELTARQLPKGDAAALAALAADCEKKGLSAEARALWLRVLLVDVANADAIKALDARGLKDDVQVKFGKEPRKLSDLRATQPKWKDAYEIQTTHFVVRTDAALERALDVGFELERFHKIFYDLLSNPLDLYVFDEKELPEIRLYAGEGAYPSPPVPGQRVWFGAAENCLHAAADKPVDVPSVVEELSRQMLFSALRRSAGPTAQVSAWVATGIAQHFASAVPADRTQPWPSPELPAKPLFQRAAATDIAFDRLFRGAPNDFTDGPKAADMSACAYTLLHFFAYGRDGALRAGFGAYVREGAKGKLSMGALTSEVGLKEAEIEKAWREHVRANAQ